VATDIFFMSLNFFGCHLSLLQTIWDADSQDLPKQGLGHLLMLILTGPVNNATVLGAL
jgi:hypothetical protein